MTHDGQIDCTHSPFSQISHSMLGMCVSMRLPVVKEVSVQASAEILAVMSQEQSLVDIEMPGQYMNGDEPSPDGIVFLEGISSNVHVSSLAEPLALVLLNTVFWQLVTCSGLLPDEALVMIAEKRRKINLHFFSAGDKHIALGPILALQADVPLLLQVWLMLTCRCGCPACIMHKVSAYWLTCSKAASHISWCHRLYGGIAAATGGWAS